MASQAFGDTAIRRQVLESIVRTARSIFDAAASSIFLWDPDAEELSFEAVSGNGSDFLVGTRIPADRGIAGWVLQSHEPMILHEVGGEPAFARDIAESTGYVPEHIMAVPLLAADRCLGVLEVLDPVPLGIGDDARDLEFLQMFAEQATLTLAILDQRRASAALDLTAAERDTFDRLAHAVCSLGQGERAASLHALTGLLGVLSA
ncbi:hypothetical protein GCM10009760_14980 [Kitasatospora kazusensis]|uniref:GAF domain-containing protein n=1 Tax=Kitasatospora kazusensis TaxID=407974 RepID=A0ABN2Z2Z0_9ACTN